MTSTPVTPSYSAGALLFGDVGLDELADRLAAAGTLQNVHGRLAGIGDSVWAAAHKELASMAATFLDLDLASVAVSGWCKHRELVDVAQRLDGSAASAVVPLWTQDISLTQKPHVDLVVGGMTVAVVRFELKVDIKVIGVSGVVRGGALVAFEGGRCELTASFSAGGVCLARRTAQFDPHRAIPLGKGIMLVPQPRPGQPATPRGAGR
ncbi:MAG TPA: hypothetical protein VHN80_04350 [Kineosporiaceae bacterium]|jgi:hypothetical protein|nr:hypothetical protein [Kineosporiaceae bacterium]